VVVVVVDVPVAVAVEGASEASGGGGGRAGPEALEGGPTKITLTTATTFCSYRGITEFAGWLCGRAGLC